MARKDIWGGPEQGQKVLCVDFFCANLDESYASSMA